LGGQGGAGGDTAAIWFSVGGDPPLTPHPTTGVSPTPRPPEASLNSAIVIAGNPGRGGADGLGGNGGVFCTDSDSHSGSNGPVGTNGPQGPNGNFTVSKPPHLDGFLNSN
jgi:hypothetical protein